MKKYLSVFASSTGLLFLLPCLAGILFLSVQGLFGGIRFMCQLLALACGYWVVLYSAILVSKKKGVFGLVGKVALWLLIFAVLLLTILFFTVEGFIFAHGDGDDDIPSSAKVLLVLGCQVKGETPSEMLLYRIEAAYDYMSLHPDTKAVLCGGQGNGENISEAECMYRELISRGISADRLFCEDRSVDTHENVNFAAEIIREYLPNTEDVIVVTNGFHILRGKLLCESVGLNAYGVAGRMPSNPILCLNYYLREFAGVFFMYVDRIFA